MRIQPNQICKWSCAAMFVVSLVGCAGGDGPQPVSAGGVVTYDGKPLANATVIFAPQDGQRAARGATDEDGQFELSTFQSGDGALVAEHYVSVTARGPAKTPKPGSPESLMPDEFSTPGDPLIPSKYFMAKTSGLTATVTSGGKNFFTFSLTK